VHDHRERGLYSLSAVCFHCCDDDDDDGVTVMATDIDSDINSQLTYSVSDANFTVQTVNNIGYIRTAQSVVHHTLPTRK